MFPDLPIGSFIKLLGEFHKEKPDLAEDKLYTAENLGSGTFRISKPKRKGRKARQSKLKNPQRGARK